jgi:hypothetical protein
MLRSSVVRPDQKERSGGNKLTFMAVRWRNRRKFLAGSPAPTTNPTLVGTIALTFSGELGRILAVQLRAPYHPLKSAPQPISPTR